GLLHPSAAGAAGPNLPVTGRVRAQTAGRHTSTGITTAQQLLRDVHVLVEHRIIRASSRAADDDTVTRAGLHVRAVAEGERGVPVRAAAVVEPADTDIARSADARHRALRGQPATFVDRGHAAIERIKAQCVVDDR